MSKNTFMYKGTECVRQLICFSSEVSVHEIPMDAPIFGVNDNQNYDNEFRTLNSEIRPNIIEDLVKFWQSAPAVKFRFLVISFQKFIGKNSKKFQSDESFRGSIVTLFMALFQQILIECAPSILRKIPIATILRVSQIQQSEELVKALKKFDSPYQKSLISMDSMKYVNQNISETSSKEYKTVVEELINLITIKVN